MKKPSTHKFISAFQKAFLAAMLLGISAHSQTLSVNSNAPNINAVCPGDQVTFNAIFDFAHQPTCSSGVLVSTTVGYYWNVNNALLSGLGSTYTPSNLADGTVVYCTLGYTLVCYDASLYPPIKSTTYTYNSVNTITAHVLPNYPNLISVTPFQSGLTQAGSRVTYSIPPPNPNLPYVNYTWSYLDGSSNPIATYVSSVTSSSEISITLDLVNTPNVTGGITVSATPNGCTASTATETSIPKPILIFNDPPPAPTNVRVTGSTDANSISLSWVPSNTTKTVTYQVYDQDQSSLDPFIQVLPSHVDIVITPTLVTANVSGLTEPHTYKFYVTSTDTYNAVSANSIITDPYTIDHTAPPAPVVSSNSIEQTDNSVTFTWSTPMDNVLTTGYNIYLVNGPATPIATVTNNMYTASFTTIPVSYIVKAFDLKGNESLPSNQFTVNQKVNPFIIDTVTGFVGIGVNPPSEKLDVDGNVKVRGDLNVLGDYYENGQKLDLTFWQQGGFHNPNDSDPTTSLGQASNIWKQKLILNADVTEINGAISAWSGLSVGGRNKYIAGGPDLINNLPAYGIGMTTNNGMVQMAGYYGINFVDNTFGTAPSMIINNGQVTTTGMLYAKGNITLPDNSVLSSAKDLLRNRQSNVTFTNKLQVAGTDPYFQIGSLVMQDLSTSAFSSTTAPGIQGGIVITNHNISNPDAIVFGNMYYDPISQTYKSILSISDSVTVITINPQQGSTITNYNVVGGSRNGGIAINLNSVNGNIEFVAVPTINGNGLDWSLTRSQLDTYKRMVIQSNGNVGIGTNTPASKLDVNGDVSISQQYAGIKFADGTYLTSAGLGGLWKKYSTNGVYVDAGTKVGIGISNSLYPLDIEGTAGQTALNIGRGNLVVAGNANITGNTQVVNLYATGLINATEVRACVNPLGTCPPDYVFESQYPLMDLGKLKSYLEKNKHLPDVPSAKEMLSDGIGMVEMNMTLLRKVEETVLYVLQLKEEIKGLNEKIEQLKTTKK